MRRREFLQGATLWAAGAAWGPPRPAVQRTGWNAGDLHHLLPTVNHNRILIKFSVRTPRSAPPRLRIAGAALTAPPRLRVAGAAFAARPAGTTGRFWAVDAAGLEPVTTYELSLEDDAAQPLCDPWPLSTFPAPSDRPERMRLLVYTCAGGRFLPMASKHRLLDRGLSFQPDALIAIGDHVYWDQRRTRMGSTRAAIEFAGRFDRTMPVLGTPNEAVLTKVVSSQVAELYETRCRSLPVFFLQDDHDYFENDHADEEIVTFPPDPFMLRLGRASQWLYYPEFLPDAHRPPGLPGASAADRPEGVSESLGTLRYGRLLEVLLYDCRRFMSLQGPTATFVPPQAERWLLQRMAEGDTRHLINLPSTPVGWSAGKWGEWYPDILNDDGVLTASREKFMWQSGWRSQHDRLLEGASSMQRIPFFVSGDLHSLAEGRIVRSGDLDLGTNPVVSVISGPLGTGRGGWPSTFRGTRGLPPNGLEVDEGLPCLEENGFVLIDVEPDGISVSYFRWNNRQDSLEAIDRLEPFRRTRLEPRI